MTFDPTAQLFQLTDLITQSIQSVIAEYTAAARPVPSLECTDPAAGLDTPVIRAAVRVLEGACAQLIASVAPAPHLMLNRSFAGLDPACMNVALSARVAEQLRDGPKSSAELARSTGVDAPKLARVLRNLAVKHCFTEVEKDVYANNRLSVCLLPEQDTSAMVGFLCDDLNLGFAHLGDALSKPEWVRSQAVETSAYVLAHGKSLFERNAVETWRGERFSRGMVAWGEVHGGPDEIARVFPWQSVAPDATVCDIGGSVGHISIALLKAHPHLKIVLQDLPSVIENAKKVWEDELPQALEEQRARLETIDFLREAPIAGCDFYYLRHVLHDWPDADCITILRNVQKAMTRPGAKVLINEFILRDATRAVRADETPAPLPLLPNFGAGAQRKYLMDINMLATFNSQERTLEDFIRISQAAGFQFARLWDGGEVSLLELRLA